jgi:anti-anti-sigma regulatory factor
MACLSDLHVLHPRPGAVVVECMGEYDLTSKGDLGRLFTGLVMENDLVVIDVSEAAFIDSSFLHNLVVADRLARQLGSRLRLQHGTTVIVMRALEVSGILTLLDSVSTREAALAPTAGGGRNGNP